ncbi:ABC transporter permease [Galactobacter sp.]|uniref:ABC transporter permease n=1 Tax=Galactobacter sp. TaxID=2676125 RepID=UPI0025B7BC41|nr:ABC transporter permease [Galactobacter sp.]
MTLTSRTEPVGTEPVANHQVPDASSSAPAGSGASRRVLTKIALRIGGALVTLWGAATVAFLSQLALPGNKAQAIFNIRAGQATERSPEELAPVVDMFGLDHPVLGQYFSYLGGLLRGDLGLSYQQFRPVTDVIGEQLPATLTLTLTAILLAWVLMVVWTLLTAGRSKPVRVFGELTDAFTASLPHYWLGIILLLVFAAGLGWFPVISGSAPIGIVLPALTLAIPLAGFMSQSMRTEFEDQLRQPFVTTARTRGMRDTAIRVRHVLRHSLIPPVTLSGWALGATISGAVVVETVYSRGGVGSALVQAVNSQDLPIVTGVVVLIAALYVIANLVVDVLYVIIDPRLKAS